MDGWDGWVERVEEREGFRLREGKGARWEEGRGRGSWGSERDEGGWRD